VGGLCRQTSQWNAEEVVHTFRTLFKYPPPPGLTNSRPPSFLCHPRFSVRVVDTGMEAHLVVCCRVKLTLKPLMLSYPEQSAFSSVGPDLLPAGGLGCGSANTVARLWKHRASSAQPIFEIRNVCEPPQSAAFAFLMATIGSRVAGSQDSNP